MTAEANEHANARGGLYNPYPRHETACGRPWGAAGRAIAAIAAALAVAAHQRLVVHGASMAPTLAPGDRLLVRRWPRALAPGVLVVVADPRAPGRLVVKRVAAVDADAVTVLGDNPAASTDSRAYGALPRSAVRGRVVYRYAPAGRAGRIARIARMGRMGRP